MFTRFAPFACAAVLAAALAVPASANDAVTQSVSVHTQDLNLNTPAGVATLKHRIAHAAEAACGPSSDRASRESADYVACRQAALESVKPQVEAILAAAKANTEFAEAPADKR
jgi:UrcA family protein